MMPVGSSEVALWLDADKSSTAGNAGDSGGGGGEGGGTGDGQGMRLYTSLLPRRLRMRGPRMPPGGGEDAGGDGGASQLLRRTLVLHSPSASQSSPSVTLS